MQIGKMRHRLTIQARDDTATDGFRAAANWANGDTVWASVSPLGAGERGIASQIMPSVTHKIVIRDGHTVNSEDRLQGTMHGVTRTFVITGLRRLPDDKGSSFLELMCQEQPGE